jgi:hypothetical protein
MGTHLERGQKHTKIPHPAPQRKKNWTPHDCMLSLIIGCVKVLFPKLFVPIFDLG